jgi:hypothetical protein
LSISILEFLTVAWLEFVPTEETQYFYVTCKEFPICTSRQARRYLTLQVYDFVVVNRKEAATNIIKQSSHAATRVARLLDTRTQLLSIASVFAPNAMFFCDWSNVPISCTGQSRVGQSTSVYVPDSDALCDES